MEKPIFLLSIYALYLLGMWWVPYSTGPVESFIGPLNSNQTLYKNLVVIEGTLRLLKQSDYELYVFQQTQQTRKTLFAQVCDPIRSTLCMAVFSWSWGIGTILGTHPKKFFIAFIAIGFFYTFSSVIYYSIFSFSGNNAFNPFHPGFFALQEKIALFKEHIKDPYFADRVKYVAGPKAHSVDLLCITNNTTELSTAQQRFLHSLDRYLEIAKNPMHLRIHVEHMVFCLDPYYPGNFNNPQHVAWWDQVVEVNLKEGKVWHYGYTFPAGAGEAGMRYLRDNLVA